MQPDLLRGFTMNIEYAHALLADVADEQMAAQPVAGMNHPAWITGRLARSFQRDLDR